MEEDIEKKKRVHRISMMHGIINLCDSQLVVLMNNDEEQLMKYIHNGEIKNFWKRFLEIVLIDNYNGMNRGDQLTTVQARLANMKKIREQTIDMFIK